MLSCEEDSHVLLEFAALGRLAAVAQAGGQPEDVDTQVPQEDTDART